METFDQLYARLRESPEALNAKLRADCQMGDGDVIPSLQRQAQTYMEWGYIHAAAEAEARRAKYEFQEDIPALFRERAEDACKAEGKKATINSVQDKLVLMDPYRDARIAFIKAEQLANCAKHAVEAMKHRLYSLQSLNSRQKSELNTLPREI